MSTGTASLKTLIAGVCATALVLLAMAAPDWNNQDGTLLAALVGLAVLSEMADFSPLPNSSVSMSIAMICAAGILGGVFAVAIVALATAMADQLLHRVTPHKAAYNCALLIVSGAAFAGTVDVLPNVPDDSLLEELAPVTLGALVAFGVNAGLVALAVSIETGRRPWQVASADLGWMLPHYLVIGTLGWFMAMAYDRWELPGLGLLLVPLCLDWLVIRRYTDHNPRMRSLRHVHAPR